MLLFLRPFWQVPLSLATGCVRSHDLADAAGVAGLTAALRALLMQHTPTLAQALADDRDPRSAEQGGVGAGVRSADALGYGDTGEGTNTTVFCMVTVCSPPLLSAQVPHTGALPDPHLARHIIAVARCCCLSLPVRV